MPQPKKPTMTSLEAAALIASEGTTTDHEKANAMSSGQILDEDKLIRAFYRRELGFDLTVLSDEKARKWIARDDELGLKVTGMMSSNPDQTKATNEDGMTLARMVMRLKRMHDKQVKEQV